MDEDLCSTARETILSFGTEINVLLLCMLSFHNFFFFQGFNFFPNPSAGKKGFLAFQKMDQLYTEMQEEAYQNRETEITIL